jgi:hypothetical protein
MSQPLLIGELLLNWYTPPLRIRWPAADSSRLASSEDHRHGNLYQIENAVSSKQCGSGSFSRHHGHIKITKLKQTSQRHIRISGRTDPTSGADFQEFIVAQLQNAGQTDGFSDHVSIIERYPKIGIEHT